MSDFSHRTLPDSKSWFRLLKLQPLCSGHAVSQLQIDLQDFDLSRAPSYKALSYTWGSPVSDLPPPYDKKADLTIFRSLRSADIDWTNTTWTVCINQKRFQISRNLRDFLLRFVKGESDTWIWIDAICINQKDTVERANQVGIMSQIYGSAETVIVWLGEQDESIEAAHRLQNILHQPLVKNIRDDAAYAALMSDLHPSGKQLWRRLGIEPIPLQWWWSWIQLFRRTWFQRVWTMQEYALAKSLQIQCGSLLFNPEALNLISKYTKETTWASYLRSSLGQDCPSVEFVDSVWFPLVELHFICSLQIYPPGSSIRAFISQVCGGNSIAAWMLLFLVWARGRKVSDSRDNIYGMLGMMQALQRHFGTLSPQNFIEVDYSRSSETLSKEVAIIITLSLPFFTYLSLPVYRPINEVVERGLPSWVMDLNDSSSQPMSFGLLTSRERACYDVSGGSRTDNMQMTERFGTGATLKVRGLVYDRIDKDVIDVPETSNGAMSNYLLVSQILKYCACAPQIYPSQTQIGTLEAIWRTLIADVTHTCPAEQSTEKDFRSWLMIQISDVWRYLDVDKVATMFGSCIQDLQYIEQRYPQHLRTAFPDSTQIGEIENRFILRDEEMPEDIVQGATRYHQHLAHAQRKIVASGRGLLALVPEAAQTGDTIMILEGARVPFILRRHDIMCKTDDGKQEPMMAFQLIGEAYVHGIMQGELFSMMKAHDLQLRWQEYTII